MSGINFGDQKSENSSAGLWLAINLYLDIGDNPELSRELLAGMIAQDPKLKAQLAFLGLEV
jgi:hypothetical protein